MVFYNTNVLDNLFFCNKCQETNILDSSAVSEVLLLYMKATLTNL